MIMETIVYYNIQYFGILIILYAIDILASNKTITLQYIEVINMYIFFITTVLDSIYTNQKPLGVIIIRSVEMIK